MQEIKCLKFSCRGGPADPLLNMHPPNVVTKRTPLCVEMKKYVEFELFFTHNYIQYFWCEQTSVTP